MPRDWNEIRAQSANPDLSGEFNYESERREQAEPPRDFSATVRAEINNRDEAADALDRHDEAWNRERDKLAAKVAAAPRFSPDGATQDSAIDEYEERRERWEEQRDWITESYERDAWTLRENGQSLSATFDAAGPAPECDLSEPDMDKEQTALTRDYGPRGESLSLDADQAPGLQAEFTRGAPGRSGHSR